MVPDMQMQEPKPIQACSEKSLIANLLHLLISLDEGYIH